jgi:hypothetical protein
MRLHTQIFADIPIALGGPLEIRISDVVLVFEATDMHLDVIDAQRALQVWTRLECMHVASRVISHSRQGHVHVNHKYPAA